MRALGGAIARTAGLGILVAGVALVAVAWPQSLGGRVAYVRVDGWSMNPTLHNGDLAVVRRQSSYRVGDVVAYRIPHNDFGAGALVIHRLVAGDGTHGGFVTRGDNRNINDPWHPHTGDVVGRVRFDLPGAGGKFAQASQPVWIGGLVAGTTVFVMVLPTSERGRRRGRRRHVAPNGPVHPDGDNSSTFPSSSGQDVPTHHEPGTKAYERTH